jgi:hypothetical protein
MQISPRTMNKSAAAACRCECVRVLLTHGLCIAQLSTHCCYQSMQGTVIARKMSEMGETRWALSDIIGQVNGYFQLLE